MEVEIGQQVLVPHRNGEGMFRATVVAYGEPADAAEENTVERRPLKRGRPLKRDVAIIRYDEGELEGTYGKVRYDLIAPAD
jgi:hypothetical protein